MAVAVWRWPSGEHLASWTPEAAVRLLQRQRGILGWRARAAPSATRLSASQSNCSKWRKERNLASCDSYLELMNHITVEIIPSTLCIKRCGVAKPNTKETKIGEHYSQSQASYFFYVQLWAKVQSLWECLSACMRVCPWARRAGKEIWPWTLCLTGPFSKKKKKVISHFFTLSGFSQNRFVIELSIHRTNLMGYISCNHDPPKPCLSLFTSNTSTRTYITIKEVQLIWILVCWSCFHLSYWIFFAITEPQRLVTWFNFLQSCLITPSQTIPVGTITVRMTCLAARCASDRFNISPNVRHHKSLSVMSSV